MGNFVVLIFLLIIAIIDIKKKTIHNKTSLLTLLIGLFLYKKIYLTGLLVATLILIICIFIDENYKGGGDIKFIGVIGLLKGFNFTIEFYIISEILCVIYRKITKKYKKEEIAYAPFMFLSFLIKTIFL
ncbi:MAG: prepilin peptidase [Clostridiales bacterium]|nr:prepilin peptidase [Clostridiales bacterium]